MAAGPLPVDVALLPFELTPGRLEGRRAVVLDVLRFSTAIVRAFEAGAASARPVPSPEEALRLVAEGAADLACGESGGFKPPGFDLGNSPLEFRPEVVAARRLACATTNGTRALLACAGAAEVWVGSLRNSRGVASLLARGEGPVLLVCAGTGGRFALEDALGAGAILEQLAAFRPLAPSDGARAARALWREVREDPAAALREADHGQTLLALGFGDDVAFAAEEDPAAPVPSWDAARGLLTLSLGG